MECNVYVKGILIKCVINNMNEMSEAASLVPCCCHGCGDRIPNGTARRRDVKSQCSRHFSSIWKKTVNEALQNRDTLKTVVEGIHLYPRGHSFICRKCFQAHESFKKAKEKLSSSINFVLDYLQSERVVTVRPEPANV